jgi:hypothetical protein
MLAELIMNHQVLSILLFAALSIVVGLIEQIGFGRTDLACITWFLGVLVVSIGAMRFEEFGQLRLLLGTILLVGGSFLIAMTYRNR